MATIDLGSSFKRGTIESAIREAREVLTIAGIGFDVEAVVFEFNGTPARVTRDVTDEEALRDWANERARIQQGTRS